MLKFKWNILKNSWVWLCWLWLCYWHSIFLVEDQTGTRPGLHFIPWNVVHVTFFHINVGGKQYKYDRNIHGRIRLLASARRAPQLRTLPNYRDQQCARWVLVAVVHSRRWFGQVRGVFFVPWLVLEEGPFGFCSSDSGSMFWHLQRWTCPIGLDCVSIFCLAV